MRLGTKFVFLIAGTIVVPVVAMSLAVLVAFATLPSQSGPAATIRTAFALGAFRKMSIDPAKIARMMHDAAPTLDYMVLDNHGALLSSSFPSDSLRELLSKDDGSHALLSTRFPMRAPDGTRYSVLVSLPMKGTAEASWQRFIPMVVLLSILGFMILMSIFIIRSINASIAHLEESTLRIADGDLDFELKASGNDRIATLTRSFDNMRRRVREETAARSRFIMAVSHDLKTPLSSITGYLDAIGDGIAANPSQLEKYLGIIRDKAGLLESRIGQLIDYVKLDTAEWRRSRESTPFAGFLNEAVTVFRTEAEARGFAFDASIDVAPGVMVFMDGDLVYRALENLVQNAFRYGEPSSSIVFHARAEGGLIILRVTNRGKAIPAEDLPFIFEPFFRGTRARREGGFGLGLTVVKSVVESHGWSIAAASQDGETSFAVTIPPADGASNPSTNNKL